MTRHHRMFCGGRSRAQAQVGVRARATTARGCRNQTESSGGKFAFAESMPAVRVLLTIGAVASSTHSRWSLEGHSAVVTGGSKGLGRAVVEELLSQGCTVLTCARDLAPLEGLLQSNDRCFAIEADVATVAGRAALIDELQARFGERGLDILVNNVGTNLRKASTDYTEAEYEMLHSTNQASAFHLSRGCYESLKKARGCVVSVSSVSGSSNDATGAVYHMTKASATQAHLSRPPTHLKPS